MILAFFYIYLPTTTNHGESLTVPDLVGISVTDLDQVLLERNLRFEISDSVYSNKYPPLTILQQFPKPGAKVKENRKIYVSVNRVEPPNISMPDLTVGSLKNAEAVLTSFELKRGKILYKPDLAFNRVLEQRYNGKNIEMGTKIPKGAVIDLVVGDGLGRKIFSIGNMVGMDFDDAQTYLRGTGLRIGIVINSGDSTTLPISVVTRQEPPEGGNVRIGQRIDLWITPSDSINVSDPAEIIKSD